MTNFKLLYKLVQQYNNHSWPKVKIYMDTETGEKNIYIEIKQPLPILSKGLLNDLINKDSVDYSLIKKM